ncbi:MAG: M15 family metallopeptidase [Proteobacteria bacterium]|nr:M15 family metallopeptidase [Pseudomonadota bacterium]
MSTTFITRQPLAANLTADEVQQLIAFNLLAGATRCWREGSELVSEWPVVGSQTRAAAAEPPPVVAPLRTGPPTDAALLLPDRDLALLHPRLRGPVVQLLQTLNAAELPFQVFEGYRTPERQRMLYAKGRTAAGAKVTNAEPWESLHQYGVAVDLVLRDGMQWSWNAKGGARAQWDRMRTEAGQLGLHVLEWELPHVELPLALEACSDGSLLRDGDESWFAAQQMGAQRWAAAGGDGAPRYALADRPAMVA